MTNEKYFFWPTDLRKFQMDKKRINEAENCTQINVNNCSKITLSEVIKVIIEVIDDVAIKIIGNYNLWHIYKIA